MKLLFSATLLTLAGLACCQDCTFDANRTSDQRCGWSNEYEDDFDWSVRRLPSPTPFTGPSGDHTTGSGNYLYTEASGRDPGETARIYSPFDSPANVAGSNMTMISFWYSMWDNFYGGVLRRTNMGTLNVYIAYDGKKVPTDSPVWSRTGSQTDRSGWKEAKIMFTAPSPFRIIFEGVIGDGERSDIGIDDVMVKQPEIPSTCDFEGSELGDLCMFYQEDLTDDFDWKRHSGETPSLDTGPLTDHTLGDTTGHYMYIETTREDVPATAVLKSLSFFKESTSCFVDVYYHAYGDNVGGLKLNVLLTLMNNPLSEVTYTIVEPGNSTDEWIQWTREVVALSGHYTLSFIGSRGEGNLGDIAIDDVSLSDGCFYTDACANNPCHNGGVCYSEADITFCICNGGWTGPTCEEDILYCELDRCPEWAICEELQTDFKCVCPDGYQGSACQDKIPTIEPPEPLNIRTDGVDPGKIPVIIGSCVGSFILLVTAAWFTASCIRNDGYHRKAQVIEGVKSLDVEEGVKSFDDGEEGGSNAYVNTTYDPNDPDGEGKSDAGTSSSGNVSKAVEVVEEVPRGSETKGEKASEETEGENSWDKDMKPLDYEDAINTPSGSGEKMKEEENVKENVYEDVKDVVKDGKESENVEEVGTKPKEQQEEDVREVEKTTPTDLSTKYDDDAAPEEPEEDEKKGVVAAPEGSEESEEKEVVLTTSL